MRDNKNRNQKSMTQRRVNEWVSVDTVTERCMLLDLKPHNKLLSTRKTNTKNRASPIWCHLRCNTDVMTPRCGPGLSECSLVSFDLWSSHIASRAAVLVFFFPRCSQFLAGSYSRAWTPPIILIVYVSDSQQLIVRAAFSGTNSLEPDFCRPVETSD